MTATIDDGLTSRAVGLLLRAAGMTDEPGEHLRAIATGPDRELGVGRAVTLVATGTWSPAPAPTTSTTTAPAHPELEVIGPPAPVYPIIEGVDLPRGWRVAARAFLWTRNCGLIVVLFVAYQLWGTSFQQARAQQHLRTAFPVAVHPAVTTGAATTAAATPPALPGGVVAHLQIPAIHLDQYVVEGTGVPDLRKGPGHYANTPLPGRHGNAAIAGHRTTYGAPFNRLDELHPGDVVLTTTATGTATYAVASEQVVMPTNTSVVDDFGDDRLTLTTCTPKFSAARRLVVVATLVSPPTTGTGGPPPTRVAAPPSPPTKVVATNTAATRTLRAGDGSFDLGALPAALLTVLALVALGLAYRPLRRRLPPLGTVVVLAPLWIAGLLVLFEHLTRFLPANV